MAGVAAPNFAHAQSTVGKGVEVGEIVVTGSRIRRDTFDAPLPLATVSADQIREAGNVILGDTLMEVTTINASSNAQNTSSTLFNSGQARVDIRGLGASRTLVLMDGRRHVNGDTQSPAVDLNMIPSLMIERVEVQPGGVSAVYGSDAIAGVVNLIMKKSYDGLQLDVQGGISQQNDGAEFIAGAIWGKKFMDDRLSVVVGAEIGRQEPIMQVDRADRGLLPGIRRNSATGVVNQTILPNSRSTTSPYATFQLKADAGVSLTNPFGTTQGFAVTRDVRDPSQIVRLSPACSLRTASPLCQDESLFYSGVYNALQNKTSRGTIRGYADYALTDHMKLFGEASFARVDAYGIFQPAFSSTAGGGTMPVSLKGDNAYLNTSQTAAAQELRGFWSQAGLTFTQASTANVGKFWQEFGGRDVETRRHTTRVVGGVQGDFDTLDHNFAYEVYAQYGELQGITTSFGVPNIARVQAATDAVALNGQIVCRSVTARAEGCVPWDLINGPSSDAVLYANGLSTTTSTGKQTVVAGNVTFDLLKLPAGPVGVALGAEYRKEQSEFVQDALGASGALFFNAIGTRAGEFDVKEAYGEIRVPILKDLPFAYDLSVEGALRGSDYSTIGQTHQYRMAAEYAPFHDIRFRASQATAVRAPNIVELYSPQSRNFTQTASDPCDSTVFAGATAAQQAARRITCAAAIPNYNPATFQSNFGTGRPSLPLLQGGNPDLGPETAKTYDVGVVIQPRWIPNLQISVDYFKYNIEQEVGTIPINTLFQNLCYDSTQPYQSNPFCTLIRRDPTGTNGGAVVGGVIEAVLTNQNVAKVKVEGIDFSVAYSFDIGDVLKGADYGRLALRVDGTDMYQWALQGLPGQAYTQFANTIPNATPRWKVTGTVNWTHERLSVNWTTHYIGSMIANNAFQPNQLTPYYTGDYFEHDLRVRYKLTDNVDLRGGVNNITDEYPPYLPETYTGTGTGSSTFDNRGRFFYAGATLRY